MLQIRKKHLLLFRFSPGGATLLYLLTRYPTAFDRSLANCAVLQGEQSILILNLIVICKVLVKLLDGIDWKYLSMA